MNKKVFAALLVLAVASGFAYAHFKGTGQMDAAPKRQPALVSIAPVMQKDMPMNVSAVGTVVAHQSVAVRARIDSQIIEVKFHAGDTVTEGDPLFVLDDRTLKAQIAEQESNLVRDQAQEKNLALQYERKKKLAGQGYDTQENLEAARSAYESQHATVAATAAALENLKVQLQYTQINAPISGRTGTVALTAGNNVKANDATPLVTINQVKPIWAQVALPQRYMDDLRRAKTTGDVPASAQHEGGEPVPGALDYIDNNVDPATGTFAARVLFPNADETLWPGMFVTVTLTLGTAKGVLVVPEVSVQHSNAGDYVYVAAGDKAERRPVTVSFMQKGEAVISGGLKAGEQVITDGVMRLEDGGDIKIADQKS